MQKIQCSLPKQPFLGSLRHSFMVKLPLFFSTLKPGMQANYSQFDQRKRCPIKTCVTP